MKKFPLILFIIAIAGLLRFYNLMHDAPYFFNPDERNMANAISQFRLPSNPSQIPTCLLSQINPSSNLQPTTYKLQANNCNLNPHFFAYGQFPLYLAFVSDQLTKPLNNLISSEPMTNDQSLMTSFSSAIFYLRFYSALSSIFTVLFVYLITKLITNNYLIKISNFKFQISNLAALSAAFTPGLIQSAHFGTTESLLTFFFMASIYLSIKILNPKTQAPKSKQISNLKHQNPNVLNLKKLNLFGICLPAGQAGNLEFGILFLLSLILGLSLGTKLTGLFFFIPPLISIMVRFTKLLRESKNIKLKFIVTLEHCCIVAFLIIGSITIGILSSPYNFIDYAAFKSAVFGYEADVAIGKYPAFYTRQFLNTTPILFQLEKIFPYALGWPVLILGSLGFLLISIQLILTLFLKTGDMRRGAPWPGSPQWVAMGLPNGRTRKLKLGELQDPKIIILILSFLIYLIPNSLLFTKWTRFITPLFPFFAIFSAYFLFQIRKFLLDHLPAGKAGWFIGSLVFIGVITPGLAYISIYTHEDTRVQASEWIYKNIPNSSYILSETGNVIDIPLPLPNYQLPITNYSIISFDFYHLDDNPLLLNELILHLEKADYIFVPSRRIFANYTLLKDEYPLITKYYQLLFSRALGYEEVIRISSYPSLTLPSLTYNLNFPDEQSEETFTVFDHPVIRIYKKNKSLLKSDYEKLFK